MDDLKLETISKRFDDVEVLKAFSLEVRKGELCCLLGPSGCGKTTTLRIIAGFLEPDAGRVVLDGADLTQIAPQRRNVGLVFQNYALFPHLNVFDNVAYGLRRRKWPKAKILPKVIEVLQLVELPGYDARRIHELSGGQQQRIALARSLVTEPKLLLLDEPLSNLDARLRADMRDEIRRIQRTLTMTTVYVTHDQEEAMSLADRIVVMNQGVIEQTGAPREIYEQPATRFVADFIGRVNLLPGQIRRGSLHLLQQRFQLADAAWSDGAAVTCAIRPERLRLRPAAAGCIPAVIRDATYFGAIVRYRVMVRGHANAEHLLHVEVPSPQARYEPGQQVGLEVRVEDIRLFQNSR